MIRKLWNDDYGSSLVTSEMLFIFTILVLGLIAGLVAVRQAVNSELAESANAILSLNQSYSISGQGNCEASTAGSAAGEIRNRIPTFEDRRECDTGVVLHYNPARCYEPVTARWEPQATRVGGSGNRNLHVPVRQAVADGMDPRIPDPHDSNGTRDKGRLAPKVPFDLTTDQLDAMLRGAPGLPKDDMQLYFTRSELRGLHVSNDDLAAIQKLDKKTKAELRQWLQSLDDDDIKRLNEALDNNPHLRKPEQPQNVNKGLISPEEWVFLTPIEFLLDQARLTRLEAQEKEAREKQYAKNRLDWEKDAQRASEERHRRAKELLDSAKADDILLAEAQKGWKDYVKYVDDHPFSTSGLQKDEAKKLRLWIELSEDKSKYTVEQKREMFALKEHIWYKLVPLDDLGKAELARLEKLAYTRRIAPMQAVEKLRHTLEAIKRMIARGDLQGEAADQLKRDIDELLSGKNLATMAATIGLLEVLQFTPAAPFIDGAIGVLGWALLGMTAIEVTEDLYVGITTALDAQTPEDFDKAAKRLGKGLITAADAALQAGVAVGVAKGATGAANRINKLRRKPLPANRVGVIITEVEEAGEEAAKLAKAERNNLKYWEQPKTINGRRVYQRNDLFNLNTRSSWQDPVTKQWKRGTNLERMADGRAPVGKDNLPVNLHHLTQVEPGSLAEISGTLHRDVAHKQIEAGQSFRNDPTLTKQFDDYRTEYWKQRARELGR